MTSVSPGIRRRRIHTAGFTLIEAVISSLIIGTMFVAAVNTVGASRLSQYKTSVVTQGQMLADLLLAEILVQNYADPSGSLTFGPEFGESNGTRSGFDDVDDYHGWSGKSALDKSGSAIEDFSDWQRNITVEWVDPMNPNQVKPAETNAKRITVTVKYSDTEVISLTVIRTAHSL